MVATQINRMADMGKQEINAEKENKIKKRGHWRRTGRTGYQIRVG